MADAAALRAWVLALVSALTCRASDPLAPTATRSTPRGGMENMSLRELEIAAALPLARRGAVFRMAWLDQHFRAQPWYHPTGFDPRQLPAEDRAHSDAIARFLRTLSPSELTRRQEALDERLRRAACALAVASGPSSATRGAGALVVVLDGTGIVLFDLAKKTIRRVPATQGRQPAWAPSIAVSVDGRRLFAVEAVAGVAQVSRWEAATLRPLPPFQALDVLSGYGSPSDAYALDRDGTLALALGLERKAFRLFSLDTDEPRISLPAGPILTAASRVVVSSDRRRVLALTSDGAWLWRVPPGSGGGDPAIADAPVALPRAVDADLSPDGRWIAGTGGYSAPWLLEADESFQPRPLSPAPKSEKRFLAFSPDGQKLMAGTSALGLTIWAVPSGRVLYDQPDDARKPDCARQWAAFLPGSDAVALAGEAGGLEVLELRTGTKRVILADAAFGNPEDDRIERALLARALGRKESSRPVKELSFEEQPLLLEAVLTEAELVQWRDQGKDLRAVQALIQARRGRRFQSPRWQAYVEAQPWYRADPGFNDARLTPTDRANLALVERLRARLDPRPPSAPPAPASNRTPSDFPACPPESTRIQRQADPAARLSTSRALVVSCASNRAGRDVLHGPEWIWFANGRLELTHSFVDGLEDGLATYFFFTGAHKQTGAFVRGKRDGSWESHHRNGVLAEHARYEAGVLQGRRRRWFDSGAIALESTYRDGVPDGPWTSFYDNGRPAIVLTFRAGRVRHDVGWALGYLPDGQAWPATPHPPCPGPAPCGSALERIELDSFPPLLPEPCAGARSTTARELPRTEWRPVLEAAQRAWPADSGGGTVPGPADCVDRITMACAPDLDGTSNAEALVEISYRVVFGAGRACETADKAEAWDMRAAVALSRPAAGDGPWRARGVVGYPRCSADVCRGDERLDGFVRLPSGQTGIRIWTTSSGGACDREERHEIRTLRDGAWIPVLGSTTRRCGQPLEPEEDDVF
jgi:antitoxin component YwqK of YwqJK toxin-antitoxin module